MMKRIGALRNMSYQINENGQFYVGNIYIGQAATHDYQGRSMSQLHGIFTVEEGNFLPVGKASKQF